MSKPRMLTVQVMINDGRDAETLAKLGLAIATAEVGLNGLPAEGQTLRFAEDKVFIFVDYEEES